MFTSFKRDIELYERNYSWTIFLCRVQKQKRTGDIRYYDSEGSKLLLRTCLTAELLNLSCNLE